MTRFFEGFNYIPLNQNYLCKISFIKPFIRFTYNKIRIIQYANFNSCVYSITVRVLLAEIRKGTLLVLKYVYILIKTTTENIHDLNTSDHFSSLGIKREVYTTRKLSYLDHTSTYP